MFDNYIFHCSSLGALMTDPRSGSGLSETCKGELLKIWIQAKYGRSKPLENKYVEKGNMVEEDSITLYSRVHKKVYEKNTEYFENRFICGTPDIIDKPKVRDIKSCWDIFTFYSNILKPLDKGYILQVNGYCDLDQ
jgi:superfamily I DNA and/or RNA helicase